MVERANLNQALRTSLEHPETIEQGLRLAGSLIRYWEVRNYFVEGYEHCIGLLGAATIPIKPEVRANAIVGAGRLAWCQDRDADAQRHFSEAKTLYQSLGLPADLALTETYLGYIERNEGKRLEAEAHFNAAEALAQELGLTRVQAMIANGRGSLAADAGDFSSARRWKERSLASFRALEDLWIVGLVSGSLGKTCVHLVDLVAARSYLRDALTIARDLGNKWAVPFTLEAIADVCVLEGQTDKAVSLYGAASVQREALALGFSWIERAAYDQALVQLRARVPSERFAEQWDRGRGLTLSAAVKLALDPSEH